ncbi:thioredoxin-like protein [Cyathus striatus]|nr:thioredoxin-like protein [Cyathus striatus]
MISSIFNAKELEKVISYPETVVIYIYITECPYCKQMSPIFQDAASAWELLNQKTVFATFNAENDEEALRTYGISATPTTIIYHSGQEVSRVVGRKERKDFEKLLTAATAGGPRHEASDGHHNNTETRAVPNEAQFQMDQHALVFSKIANQNRYQCS